MICVQDQLHHVHVDHLIHGSVHVEHSMNPEIKDVQIKLHIDQEVTLKSQKHRSIPFHNKEDEELQRLLELDIIEKVEGPNRG